MQLNPPVELLVTDEGEVVCVALSKLTVIEDETANPLPATVTVEPMLPEVGLKNIAGVTVNEAVAVFELASVAVTVFAPAVWPTGILNDALNEP